MSESPTSKGDHYEYVVLKVLRELAPYLGITTVGDGKQNLAGASGTSWQADLVAYDENDKVIKVECKYRAKREGSIKQAEMGSLAISIIDTGAAGGIMVTCHPVQIGAIKVADKYGIRVLQLESGSTLDFYKAKLKDLFFIGITEAALVHDEGEAIVTDINTGAVERHRLE